MIVLGALVEVRAGCVDAQRVLQRAGAGGLDRDGGLEHLTALENAVIITGQEPILVHTSGLGPLLWAGKALIKLHTGLAGCP